MSSDEKAYWIAAWFLGFALVVILTGCAHRPTSCDIRIAPSAEAKVGEILDSVAWWNATIGKEVCTVRSVGSEAAIDGAVVVRMVPRDLVRPGKLATTAWHYPEETIVVTLSERTSFQATAHELGHCMGLGHVDIRDNLMFPIAADDRWGLTPDQRAEVW